MPIRTHKSRKSLMSPCSVTHRRVNGINGINVAGDESRGVAILEYELCGRLVTVAR